MPIKAESYFASFVLFVLLIFEVSDAIRAQKLKQSFSSRPLCHFLVRTISRTENLADSDHNSKLPSLGAVSIFNQGVFWLLFFFGLLYLDQPGYWI
jgi:hypothetical protein